MEIWFELLAALGLVLRFFHDATVGLFGGYSWAIAIVILTVVVRLLLLPLAVKQFRSMQAMQQLRPQMKRIQQRYKTDRGMMRTDPEKYRAQREKQQQELMALYKEHDVNPASSCLPLIAQMPIFIALFSVLRSPDVIPELVNAPFPINTTLQAPANEAGIIAILMLLAMGVTTFIQQKQMMGRTMAVADDQQLQQQKMMLYIMPVFLTFLGFNLPVGVLVYWVTTNLWQMGQQWFMLREVEHSAESAKQATKAGKAPSKRPASKDAKRPTGDAKPTAGDAKSKDAGDAKSKAAKAKDAAKSSGASRDGEGRKGGRSAAAKKGAKGASGRRDKAPSNGANRNGHQAGGPGKVSKQRDDTGDKRR
ncbi:MAG TPA: YidC/Oxa1 family membrane protein insertase [Euzebyales bacterium]|nr:YidC/Oxa1 family membrane protein insertase [Euzebyales bacterium]